jgi:hypothetical protein
MNVVAGPVDKIMFAMALEEYIKADSDVCGKMNETRHNPTRWVRTQMMGDLFSAV